MIPGKRESRRLTGDHVQTQHDLTGGWRERDDGVSIGGWAFDEHPPKGFDAWDQPPFMSRPVKEPYNIALEALYSRNVANLMMAGRNISNSHVAFTSTRVMATCACTGQAVGTAAALCVEKGVQPRELRRASLPELQQRLLRDDQTIRGVRNEDPADLAREARVSASSALAGADPEHVIDGHVRDIVRRGLSVYEVLEGRLRELAPDQRSLGVRVDQHRDVAVDGVDRRLLDPHLRQRHLELLRHQHRQRREDTLPHLGARDPYDDGVVRPDHDPGVDFGRAVCSAHDPGAERKPQSKRKAAADGRGADDKGTTIHFRHGCHGSSLRPWRRRGSPRAPAGMCRSGKYW